MTSADSAQVAVGCMLTTQTLTVDAHDRPGSEVCSTGRRYSPAAACPRVSRPCHGGCGWRCGSWLLMPAALAGLLLLYYCSTSVPEGSCSAHHHEWQKACKDESICLKLRQTQNCPSVLVLLVMEHAHHCMHVMAGSSAPPQEDKGQYCQHILDRRHAPNQLHVALLHRQGRT